MGNGGEVVLVAGKRVRETSMIVTVKVSNLDVEVILSTLNSQN